MAKLTRTLSGDFDRILETVKNGVLDASLSASLEEEWSAEEGGARCAVLVFERYSYTGANRVSMNVTLFQSGGSVQLCAVTSGGSQATFFKINTLGEEAFLATLQDVLD